MRVPESSYSREHKTATTSAGGQSESSAPGATITSVPFFVLFRKLSTEQDRRLDIAVEQLEATKKMYAFT